MPFARDVLPKQTERQFMQRVMQAARLFGWAIWRDNATNAPRRCRACGAGQPVPRNEPGWPDLILLRGDELLAVELKSDRGTLTEAQMGWLAALGAVRRVRAFVWRPCKWTSVEATLRGDGR